MIHRRVYLAYQDFLSLSDQSFSAAHCSAMMNSYLHPSTSRHVNDTSTLFLQFLPVAQELFLSLAKVFLTEMTLLSQYPSTLHQKAYADTQIRCRHDLAYGNFWSEADTHLPFLGKKPHLLVVPGQVRPLLENKCSISYVLVKILTCLLPSFARWRTVLTSHPFVWDTL